VGLDTLTLLNAKQAWAIAEDRLGMAEASAIKVYGSEFYVEGSRLLAEILGASGMLQVGSEGAALQGRLERFYRMSLVLTFGGGCNEVQRDLIGMAGLGLPRSR
jgi:alkylation response protein AidB-like acyl-CoA dehydrogenase